MSGADTREQRIKRYVHSLPGKRGVDIPGDLYDKIFAVADGVTRPLWGRPPTPEQMQHLHDQGHHEPEAIHKFYGQYPHPHASNLSVDEYQRYAKAHDVYKQHGPTSTPKKKQ